MDLTVFDGLFLGGVYYMILPLLYLIFVNSSVKIPPNIYINDFYPLGRDIDTSFYIYVSILLFGLFSLRSFTQSFHLSNTKSQKNKNIEGGLFLLIFILYVISEFVFLIKSGKLQGDSHWYSANVKVFQQGVIYTFLGQFNNVGRLFLPAICMYFQIKYNTKYFNRIHLFTSIVLLVIELLIAGNRIAILYVAFSYIIPILYFKRYKQLILISICIIPLYFIAAVWPIVRGLIWTDRLSWNHIEYVIETAFEKKDEFSTETNSFTDPIMVLTEGTNLFVLNDIYTKYPTKYEFMLGETMILRPLGVFFPKKIWVDKPETLGLIIGRRSVPDTDEIAINTSIIGESWANFGWGGNVILLILISFLQKLPFQNLGISKKFFNFLLFFIGLAIWRFDFTFFCIAILTLYIYILILRIPIVKLLLNKLFRLKFLTKLKLVK